MADKKWDSFEQTLSIFGKEGLSRAGSEAVNILRIPEQSKLFITTVGLPRQPVLLCEFNLEVPNFPTLYHFASQVRKEKEDFYKFLRRIGTDGHAQICLSEDNGCGNVFAYDLNKILPIRFINSSIELFGGFLALYVGQYCKYSDRSDDELNARACALESRMSELDPPAFDDEKNWWALVTEQMKHGLL